MTPDDLWPEHSQGRLPNDHNTDGDSILLNNWCKDLDFNIIIHQHQNVHCVIRQLPHSNIKSNIVAGKCHYPIKTLLQRPCEKRIHFKKSISVSFTGFMFKYQAHTSSYTTTNHFNIQLRFHIKTQLRFLNLIVCNYYVSIYDLKRHKK